MAESTLTVRRTGRDDWRALRDIRLEALADTPEAYGSTYAESATWSKDQWRRMAGDRLYYLALRDHAVVGMVSGGFNDAHPGTRWLYAMYVTPSDRGTGSASRLVETVAEWARGDGANELFLHVTKSIERARAFYVKCGFRPTGETFPMDRDARLSLETMVLALD